MKPTAIRQLAIGNRKLAIDLATIDAVYRASSAAGFVPVAGVVVVGLVVVAGVVAVVAGAVAGVVPLRVPYWLPVSQQERSRRRHGAP